MIERKHNPVQNIHYRKLTFGFVFSVSEIIHCPNKRTNYIAVFAGLLSLLAVVMCVALYFLEIKKNVLSREDREVYHWTSTNLTLLHFSFYGVVFASVLSVINTLIVSVAAARCPLSWRKHSAGNDKVLDGVMMYWGSSLNRPFLWGVCSCVSHESVNAVTMFSLIP